MNLYKFTYVPLLKNNVQLKLKSDQKKSPKFIIKKIMSKKEKKKKEERKKSMEQRTRHTGWSLPRKSKEKWRKKREAVSRKEEGEAEATYRKKEKKGEATSNERKKVKKKRKKEQHTKPIFILKRKLFS